VFAKYGKWRTINLQFTNIGLWHSTLCGEEKDLKIPISYM